MLLYKRNGERKGCVVISQNGQYTFLYHTAMCIRTLHVQGTDYYTLTNFNLVLSRTLTVLLRNTYY